VSELASEPFNAATSLGAAADNAVTIYACDERSEEDA
jgi:hypothetical protein